MPMRLGPDPSIADRVSPFSTSCSLSSILIVSAIAPFSPLPQSESLRHRDERVYIQGGPLGRLYTIGEARDWILWDSLEGFP